jgi:hypothetical protein
MLTVKYTDDYSAKIRLWTENSVVAPLPKLSGLPKFAPLKFRSHEEMNAWKKAYLKQIATQGGCRWMS